MSIRKDIKQILEIPDIIWMDVNDILEAIRKVVPKIKKPKEKDAVGFNKCRSEMLRKLK